MWEKISYYKKFGIEAESLRSKNERINESYKLGIFFSSFASRCLTGSALINENNCENSIIVLFDERDDKGLRDKHDRILIKQVNSITKNEPKKINISSFNVEESIDILRNQIIKYDLKYDDKVIIDISGSPKPFYLSILASFRRRVFPPGIHIFHSSGEYKKPSGGEDYSFTFGFDKDIWIPGFWGDFEPSLETSYIFLLGFEGNRVLSVLYKEEPESFYGLIGDPGYFPKYTEISKKRNSEFLEIIDRAFGEDHLIYADAGDAVETWRKLQEKFEPIQDRYNLCIVPFGTKPHAIGAALYALTSWTPSIMYKVPKRYEYNDTKRGDYIWLYKIKL